MSAALLAGVVGPGASELAAACAAVAGPPGLVLAADGPAAGSGPALRGARRVARALAAHGLPAVAAGPAAWLTAEDAGDALLAARLTDAPAVLAVAGTRSDVSDELLSCCAVVLVVAGAGDEIAELALDDLASVGLPAARLAPAGALERAALRAGLPPLPARRRELWEVLGA